MGKGKGRGRKDISFIFWWEERDYREMNLSNK